jgi:hypothetical protein
MLGDEFADIQDLKQHILHTFENFILGSEEFKHGKAYVQYCIN